MNQECDDADALFWIVAWLATAVAGGVFGLIEGLDLGLIAGPFIAAFFAIPIIISAAIVTWALWLSRFGPLMAGIAGALTGLISTSLVVGSDSTGSLVLAACIGGLVPLSATWQFCPRTSESQYERTRARRWQYSLRDLFLRFAVIAAVIAAWALAIRTHIVHLRTIPAVERSLNAD